jgi:hypothetical protein
MKTQNQCLLAIFDAYTDLVGRAVTMNEVSEWALGRCLMPTPKRGDSKERFADFEWRLAEAKRRGLLLDEESPQRLRGAGAAAALAE